MNFLLIIPRIVSKIGEAYQFPLGLPYVSAAMKEQGFHVFTCNLNQCEGTVQSILIKKIEEYNIDVIMTGGLSFQFWPIYQIVEIVKNVVPRDIITVVGGGIITSDPETAMEALEFVDIGVIGEGEITVPELSHCLEAKQPYENVAGLILNRGNNVFQRTLERSPVSDLDTLPWPDFDGFEFEKTLNSTAGISGLNTKRTIYMLASRSCPFQCSFCFHTVGRKYRQRSLDSFFSELECYIERYHIDYVCVEDELISYSSERIREFCKRIKKYGIRWWTQFRVDMVDPELLPLLKDSGCEVMSFGLESADNRVLKSMGKHTTVEQIESTLSKVVEAGIHFEGAFIFGDTAETYETANNTLFFWLKHPEYRINLTTITIFPGCPLYWKAREVGAIKNPVQYLREGCPQLNITQMSKNEFADIISKCMQYPHRKSRALKNEEMLSIDSYKARVAIKGNCAVCGTENTWEDIKLFTTNALGCENCGQRYNVFMPNALYPVFKENLEKLLSYGKIAVWGVNYVVTRLFKEIDILEMDKIFLVDSSTVKQGMDLGFYGVLAPKIINDEKISTVIVAIPAYYHSISLEIHYMFPYVKRVIDICDLIREDMEWDFERGGHHEEDYVFSNKRM